MTTLENSYCRPKTVDEWVECLPWMFEDEIVHGIVGRSFLAFGDGTLSKEPRDGMTELTATHFLDLMHDTLFAPWRLEEVGFTPCASPDMLMMDTAHGILCVSEGGVWMNHMRVMYNLTTFTDLLSLVRMLTPPSND